MRRSLLILLVAPFLALGMLTVAPAATSAAAVDEHPEWGTTSARDATLHHGCHGYGYSYALTPPDGYWALETFLVGPHGKRYGSGYFDTGSDPLAGDGSWRLCRRSSRAGRYTIRARLTVDNVVATYDGWLPDVTFRLRKPRR